MIYFRLYNVILLLASLFLIPYYGFKIVMKGKYTRSIGPKFGFMPDDLIATMKGKPRIWVHAVSVGEVTAAAPIVATLREIYPDACIVLSTSTETGQEMARRMVPAATACIYYPLDIPWVVRNVINRVRPDIFVPVETEIWPNFIRTCTKKGVKVVMVNGRMSPRSFKRYRKTRFFWKRVLACVSELGMISSTDADRVKALGVDPSKIHIEGNAKYDSLAARADETLREEMARRLHIIPGTGVFVAGSTHGGEEEIVLAVFKKILEKYPGYILIVIPRHIERSEEVRRLAHAEGFSDCILISEIDGGRARSGERVVIVDAIGELFKVYSLATIVFCGGSLVPRGGQNILEPAAWGKVIFCGPFMEDFMDEMRLLEEAGAGITVSNGVDLTDKMEKLLEDRETLLRRGDAGRRVVALNQGASRRYGVMIGKWIEPERSR